MMPTSRVRIRHLLIGIAAMALVLARPGPWIFLVGFAFELYAALAIVASADGAVRFGFDRASLRPISVASVLAAPLRLLAVEEPKANGRANRASALTIAVASSLVLAAGWTFWKYFGLSVAILAFEASNANRWASAPENLWNDLNDPGAWEILTHWEAWSQLRWWILFGTLAVVASIFDRTGNRVAIARRSLRFAPWIIVIEIGLLFGVWLARWHGRIVPEPGTMFFSGNFPLGTTIRHLPTSLWTFWLVRSVPWIPIATFVFLRRVSGLRRPAAIVGALAIVPVAIVGSIAWCYLYVRFIW